MRLSEDDNEIDTNWKLPFELGGYQNVHLLLLRLQQLGEKLSDVISNSSS